MTLLWVLVIVFFIWTLWDEIADMLLHLFVFLIFVGPWMAFIIYALFFHKPMTW